MSIDLSAPPTLPAPPPCVSPFPPPSLAPTEPPLKADILRALNVMKGDHREFPDYGDAVDLLMKLPN